jgi:hypothetical protein
MFRTALRLLIVTIALPASLSLAQDTVPDDTALNKEEQKILERTVNSYQINVLQKLYDENSKNGTVSFDHSYMIDSPLTLPQVLNFEHPYLKMKLSQLTGKDREEIAESIKKNTQRNMRHQSILNVAMKYGMESGLYKAALDYHQLLSSEYHFSMSEVFSFGPLMLADGKIKPPLIEEVAFRTEIENKRQRRTIKKRFRIAEQSEVIIDPPVYMDFFKNLKLPKPKEPQVYLLPLNDEEMGHWRKGILNGWLEGVRQANKIIHSNIRRLVRARNGYIRFHVLHERGVVSMPTHQNIAVGTNSRGDVVNIGESLFEITELPRLNDSEQDWLALPQIDDIFNALTDEDVQELTDLLYNRDGL